MLLIMFINKMRYLSLPLILNGSYPTLDILQLTQLIKSVHHFILKEKVKCLNIYIITLSG